MTYWRETEPLQEPNDLGLDASGRAQVVFNIIVTKNPSNTFLEEIVKLLVDASVGVLNTNIFTTSTYPIPEGDGPYLTITETGGTIPERTHNEIALPAFQRPAAQILVRAKTYGAARTMCRAAYNSLVGVRNQEITP
jgi:hypothetical protein